MSGKSFHNTALDFIQSTQKKEPRKEERSKPVKIEDQKTEISLTRTKGEAKSKRLQILVKPSQYDQLKTLSLEGFSINDLINRAIDLFLTIHKDKKQS